MTDTEKGIAYWADRAAELSELLHEANAKSRQSSSAYWDMAQKAGRVEAENAVLRAMVARALDQGLTPESLTPSIPTFRVLGHDARNKRDALLASVFPDKEEAA